MKKRCWIERNKKCNCEKKGECSENECICYGCVKCGHDCFINMYKGEDSVCLLSGLSSQEIKELQKDIVNLS